MGGELIMTVGLLPNNKLATPRLDASGNSMVTNLPLPEALNFYGHFGGRIGRVLRILGKRSGWVNTSTMQDVGEHLGTSVSLLEPAVLGTTYYLVSSSASDDGSPAGPGIGTLRVIGLDADGYRVAVDYVLNGTTPVSIGNTWSFLQRIEAVTGGQAAGTIYLSSAPAGIPTPAQTQHVITPGGGKSMTGIYKVPKGHTAWITHWDAEAINADMDSRLRATVSSNTRELIAPFLYQDSAYLSLNANHDLHVPWFRLPELATVKISVTPSSASTNARFNCSFDLVELENAVTVDV